MADGNNKPRYKTYIYFILAIVSIVVAIILWYYPNPSPSSDFCVSIDPMLGAIQAGGVIQTKVTVLGIHGYEQTVSLSASGLPPGIIIAFTPPSGEAKPTYISTVTVTVKPNVSVGDYTITINGIGADGKEHRCNYTLTVKPSVTATSTPTPTSTKVFPQLDIIHTTLLEEPQIGEEALVTVSIHNRGNGMAKNITLTESIPSSISVSSVGGASSSSRNLVIWSGELKPGEVHSITHTFKILEEKRIFFPAKATFKDEYGKEYEISTTITIKGSTPTPTPAVTTPIPASSPTPPATGAIDVSSSPSKANIGLDGQWWSMLRTTPDIISDVELGYHTLELSREGYLNWSKTVEVTSGETLPVHANLTLIPTPNGKITLANFENNYVNVWFEGEQMFSKKSTERAYSEPYSMKVTYTKLSPEEGRQSFSFKLPNSLKESNKYDILSLHVSGLCSISAWLSTSDQQSVKLDLFIPKPLPIFTEPDNWNKLMWDLSSSGFNLSNVNDITFVIEDDIGVTETFYLDDIELSSSSSGYIFITSNVSGIGFLNTLWGE